MARKIVKPLSNIKRIEDFVYDNKKMAHKLSDKVKEKIIGKKLVPHPTIKKTFIYV